MEAARGAAGQRRARGRGETRWAPKLKAGAAGRPRGPGAIVLGGGLGAAGRMADGVRGRLSEIKMEENGFCSIYTDTYITPAPP